MFCENDFQVHCKCIVIKQTFTYKIITYPTQNELHGTKQGFVVIAANRYNRELVRYVIATESQICVSDWARNYSLFTNICFLGLDCQF